MFEDTHPDTFHAAGGGDPLAPFRVPNSDTRLALLRELRDGSVPVLVSSPTGATLRTAVWAMDTNQQRLNFTVDDTNPQLAALVESDEAVGVAYLASVKLQFELTGLMLVRGARASTLQADLPREIYRFQRRSSYRVDAVERHAPSARLRHPAIPDMQLTLRLLDVSTGGCALWLPDDVPLLEAGTLLAEVHLELDAETRFTASLMLQHVSAIAPGEHGVRLGCEWQALHGGAERTLQRWIDLAQKRRRILSLT